jgi:hypothetical protein
MQSSNSRDRSEEWLVRVVAGVSSIGVGLTGFILVEILHIESRLAVVEWKLDSKSTRTNASLWTPNSAKLASFVFPTELFLKKKEIACVDASSSAPVPPVSAAAREKKILEIESALDERGDRCALDASSDRGLCFAVPGACSGDRSASKLPTSFRNSRRDFIGGVNAIP